MQNMCGSQRDVLQHGKSDVADITAQEVDCCRQIDTIKNNPLLSAQGAQNSIDELMFKIRELANHRYDLTKGKQVNDVFNRQSYAYDFTDKEFLELDTQAKQVQTDQDKQAVDRETFFKMRKLLSITVQGNLFKIVQGFCNDPQESVYPIENITHRPGNDVLAWSVNGVRLAYQNTHDTVAVYTVGYGQMKLQGEINLAHVCKQLGWVNYDQLDYAWSPDHTRLAVLGCDKSRAVRVFIVDPQNGLVVPGKCVEMSTNRLDYDGFLEWSSDGIRLIKIDNHETAVCKLTWNDQGECPKIDSDFLQTLGVDLTLFNTMNRSSRKAFIQRRMAGKKCTYRTRAEPSYAGLYTTMVDAQEFGNSTCTPALSCDDALLATVPCARRVDVLSVGSKEQQARCNLTLSGEVDEITWHPTLPILAIRCSGGMYLFDTVRNGTTTISYPRRERHESLYKWSADGLSFVHVRADLGNMLMLQPQIVPYQQKEEHKLATVKA